jgi:ATP-dependent Clp protease ATP-binding subunit ClpA
MAEFAVHRAAASQGGIGEKARCNLATQVVDAVAGLPPETRKRILSMVASRRVQTWLGGQERDPDACDYAAAVADLKETLGGLSGEKRVCRSPEVQRRFAARLTGPRLLETLQRELLGQDRALEELTGKMQTECLTRPPHQPLRYCAQGTPGTGKSESAVLLANHLEVPYINIDAASMPDYYTASAQLLGSGRGIVGSYESGRLEQAAKHHRGAVVELSDLDHARPAVRSCLADLFLQLLETGEGQTATGASFSCANLILAFTINLPEGKDEQIHKPLGFAGTTSRQQAAAQVNTEVKRMLSNAFLSRIGQPILFDPLDKSVLARIVERTALAAARRATKSLKNHATRVTIREGLGRAVVDDLDSDLLAFGARGVVERARSLTTEALLRAHQAGCLADTESITIQIGNNGELDIEAD